MALKRWHRTALTAAGMLLAMAVILPPRPLPHRDESGWGLRVLFEGASAQDWESGANYKWTLSGALGYLRTRVRAAHMADSLLAQAAKPRALHSADGKLTVEYGPALTADSARVWLRMLERELTLAPRTAGNGVPVIVALRTFSAHKSSPSVPEYLMMRFLSPHPERPACMVALRLGRSHRAYDVSRIVERDPRSGAARTAVLNWCLAHARFGTPGPQVSKWVSQPVQVTYSYSGDVTLNWALDAERRGRLADSLNTWLVQPYEYFRDPTYAACVHGSRPRCLSGVGLASDGASSAWNGWTVAMARSRLLASLMLKDPERFGRFWRSPEPPAAALEAAFGRPAADLVADWARSVYRLPATGPRTPARALLSSLGWAALAIGLGVLAAGRRQVDS